MIDHIPQYKPNQICVTRISTEARNMYVPSETKKYGTELLHISPNCISCENERRRRQLGHTHIL